MNNRAPEPHFDFFEEGPSGWEFVDDVTLASMGWGTAKARRDLNVVGLCRRLNKMAVGVVLVEDGGMRGRTKFVRRA